MAEIARKHKIPLIVDNTVPTPALLNPIKFGANIVIHSLTKYINGNGTALGGAIIDAGTFDWSSGKFEEFTQPSPGYHGLVYHEALGPAAFIAKVRIEGLRDFGSALSPPECLSYSAGARNAFAAHKKAQREYAKAGLMACAAR